jgi:hypothetical protein
MRDNLNNVLNEGLRIRKRRRRINSKVKGQENKAKLDVYCDKAGITSLISVSPWPTSPGPYL